MIGVICYLIGTIAPYWWTLSAEVENTWVTTPFNVGGAAFIAGSYLYLVSCTESFLAFRWHPRSFAFWISWLNFIGSVLYLLGSAIVNKTINSSILVASWVPIFVGFTIGSVIFLIAGKCVGNSLHECENCTSKCTLFFLNYIFESAKAMFSTVIYLTNLHRECSASVYDDI